MKKILIFFATIIVISSCGENKFNASSFMERQTEDDGFEWYKFEFDGKYGIADKDGNVLVMPRYISIDYHLEGKFLELKKIYEGDTLIVIKDNNYHTKIPLSFKIKSFNKKKLKNDSRYFYTITAINDEGDIVKGAFSKDWLCIIFPVLSENCSISYCENSDICNGLGAERFAVSEYHENGALEYPLFIRMNSKGDPVLFPAPHYINFYQLKNNDPSWNCRWVLSFYGDYIIREGYNDGIKYEFKKFYDGYKMYNGDNNYVFVDDSYNLKLSYYEDRIYCSYELEQCYDSYGRPLTISLYKCIEDKLESFIYHKKIVSANKTGAFGILGDLDDLDDEYLTIRQKMHESANSHFWNFNLFGSKNEDDDSIKEVPLNKAPRRVSRKTLEDATNEINKHRSTPLEMPEYEE